MLRRWVGQIVREGEETGDGRLIAAGALRWETPLPFAWMTGGSQHVDMSTAAPTVGTVDAITRGADGWLTASGTIDDDIPEGAELVRMLEAGSASHGHEMGVSVDMDDMTIEIIDRTLDDGDDEPALAAAHVGPGAFRLQGLRLDTGSTAADGWPAAVLAAAGDPDDGDGVVVWTEATGDVLMRVTDARLRGLTAVATPAFADARIELDGDGAADEPDEPDEDDEADDVAVVAAAVKVPPVPPRSWFAAPDLDAPTPLTIEPSGRIFGHLAAWGTCHTGFARCVQPPRGGDYSTFMSAGRLSTDAGPVDTGALVWGIPHADLSLTLLEAFAHYAAAQHGFADVRVGEDAHGIWFAGSLRPGLEDDDVRLLQALSISGDWRSRSGRLDLIAGLAVNVPGFPIPRQADPALAASAAVDPDTHLVAALVAAGVVPQDPERAAAAAGCGCGCGSTPGPSPTASGDLSAVLAALAVLEARTRHLVPAAVAAAARHVRAG